MRATTQLTRASRPFSLNQTGTLLRRLLAHFVAAVDTAVIDPVLDYDPASGAADTHSIDAVLDAAQAEGLTIEWVLETHAHADHLSAAPVVKAATGARIGIGARIDQVQRIFKPMFRADDLEANGACFDRMFADGETFALGGLTVEAMATPGHTPACVSYRIGDAVFVGDTLFMPDYGTARCDFPGGDAATLYRSIRRILDLPGETRLFMCHDYLPEGRETYLWETTVAEERAHNVQIRDSVSEAEFVALRHSRDKDLATPKLLLPSIQVNIRAGHFPPPDDDGKSRLVIPVTFKGRADAAA